MQKRKVDKSSRGGKMSGKASLDLKELKSQRQAEAEKWLGRTIGVTDPKVSSEQFEKLSSLGWALDFVPSGFNFKKYTTMPILKNYLQATAVTPPAGSCTRAASVRRLRSLH